MWSNSGETGLDANGNNKATNGIDDDGNNYVDDVRGYNFGFQQNVFQPQGAPHDALINSRNPIDVHGHGTHVAGIIGASGNNTVDVRGVSPHVQIMALKIFHNDDRSSSAMLADAIRYAADKGAKIINASLTQADANAIRQPNIYIQAVKDAIEYARDKGVLFVAAAGNTGRLVDNANQYYPGTYDVSNTITVANTDINDNLSPNSNFGGTKIHLSAPGTEIWSTLPTDATSVIRQDLSANKPASLNGNYGKLSGTSMAAPHVAGAAALVLAKYNTLAVKHLKYSILGSVDKVNALQGNTIFEGRLNVNKALSLADDIANARIVIQNDGLAAVPIANNNGSVVNAIGTFFLSIKQKISADAKTDAVSDSTQHTYEATGKTIIQTVDSSSNTESSLVTADGTMTVELTYDAQTKSYHTTGNGIIHSNLGGVDKPLFKGDYTVDTQTGKFAVTEGSEELQDDFQLNEFEVKIDNLGFDQNRIELQGHVTLPDSLGGLEVAVNGNDKILISQDGVSVTGGSLKLPGERTFKALGLLEVKTQEAALNFKFEQKEVSVGGTFIVPTLNNATLNLSGTNHLTVKQTEQGLQFAALADITVDSIPIFGDWKFQDVRVNVNKSFDNITNSVTGNAKLYTSSSNFLNLTLAFENGHLKEVEATSPAGTDFTFLGADVDISHINFKPDINPGNDDYWEPQLILQGALTLPQSLGGIRVEVTGSNQITVNESGISMTGAAITLPDDRKFKALDLLEIQTKEAQLKFDAQTQAFSLGGTFIVPTLNNATLNLSNGKYITVKNTPLGLQFAADAELSVAEIPISGAFKVQNLKVNVKKPFDSAGSVTGSAKLYTSATNSLDLSVAFADGKLNKISAESPAGNDFTWMGAGVDIHKVEFIQDRNPNDTKTSDPQLEIQGAIALPEWLSGAKVDITGPNKLIVNDSGLSLNGAKVTIPDFDFKLLKLLEVKGTGVAIKYQNTPSEQFFKLQGTISVPTLYNLTADFSGEKYIKVGSNGIEIYGSLSAEQIKIVPGVWEIKDIKITLDTRNKTVIGTTKMLIPTGIELGATIGFKNGVLDEVRIEADRLNKPIGSTGAFLQRVAGEFHRDPTATFSGAVDITAGASFSLSLPSWAGGNMSGSLVELGLNGSITQDRLKAHGGIKVLGGLIMGLRQFLAVKRAKSLARQAKYLKGGQMTSNLYRARI